MFIDILFLIFLVIIFKLKVLVNFSMVWIICWLFLLVVRDNIKFLLILMVFIGKFFK